MLHPLRTVHPLNVHVSDLSHGIRPNYNKISITDSANLAISQMLKNTLYLTKSTKYYLQQEAS